MACGTCNTNTPAPVARSADPEGIVVRGTQVTAVVGVNGTAYPLNQPLAPASHFPRGRWGAFIRVAGIFRFVDKPTAIEVFNEAMRIMQLNGEDFWFIDLWLNLNLQWVAKVPAKHRIVTVQQLEAISEIIP